MFMAFDSRIVLSGNEANCHDRSGQARFSAVLFADWGIECFDSRRFQDPVEDDG